MDISQYYDEAETIGKLVKTQAPYILSALDYPPEDDHPSSETAGKALDLYIQGAIMENSAEHKLWIKIGVSCLVLGVAIGWLIWG
ncbi:hypothetical protein ACL7TT_06655 [Microbulbifer sp. 2304DJ12-6]|uniref:hypothetical protein n=1 Tax=Microbulbifer sp. 2304DJ12-6 TaxID=3233340 RepID=UPI0026249C93|nr:hypothetical protein [uncultured Microbulbifer sp.]